MPPRLRVQSQVPQRTVYVCLQCRRASLASATTPAPPLDAAFAAVPPIARYPRTQPPSHKPPEFRKSQLHRQYQSLLRSSLLTLVFQHNNLKANEWMGIRRELATALRKVDAQLAQRGNTENVGDATKLQVVQTGIFASALRVVEFWDPVFEKEQKEAQSNIIQPTDPMTASSRTVFDTSTDKSDPAFTHGLSTRAREVAHKAKKRKHHGLEAILTGPLALLTLPSVSPQHLKAAISILSPSPDFPAPRRRENPGYHEPAVQNGLSKLMLLAARVEGKVFDTEGAKWVGSIEGGIDGLRAQLVAMLTSVGADVTSTLEAVGRSLYFTVEGRRGMLEEEGKAKEEN